MKNCKNCNKLFEGPSYQKFCQANCKHNFRLNRDRKIAPEIVFLEGEIWKDVVGYEDGFMVSSFGRIMRKEYTWSKPDDNIPIFQKAEIKKLSEAKGYMSTSFTNLEGRKNIRIHIIVAKAFHPNPENKTQVNHINGIKSDNRASNLEWSTPSENGKHAYRLGLNHVSEYQRKQTSISNSGSNSHLSKLSESDITNIRKMKSDGLKNIEIAKIFKVHRETIGNIIRGNTWRHVA